MNREAMLAIMRQKSTIAGMAGIVVTLISQFGVEVSEEQRAAIMETMLVIMSVVAIATQPKPKEVHPHGANTGPAGGNRHPAGHDIRREQAPPAQTGETTDQGRTPVDRQGD